MSDIILPKTDVLLSTCSSVAKITKPLEKFGIMGFCYTKIFDDGSMIDISDRQQAAELLYYDKGLYKECAQDICPEMYQGEYLLDSCAGSASVFSSTLHSEFGITFALNLFGQGHNYFESVWFCTQRENDFLNFCVNSVGVLKSFIQYFKKESADIINQHENDKITRYICEQDKQKAQAYMLANNYLENEMSSDMFNQSLFHDPISSRYYLPTKPQTYLTAREKECLYWSVVGKTAEETALILNISKRTVELHLRNIMRDKLHVYNKVQLVKKVIKLNLFPELV